MKNNIATVLKQQGKIDETLKLYQEALETTIQAVRPSHVSVAKTKKDIGTVYEQRGDEGLARQYYQETYAIYLKSLGADHPNTRGLARFV